MNDAAKKQPKPAPAAKDEKKKEKKQSDDSSDVERAVYDGMQDLRVKKPRQD